MKRPSFGDVGLHVLALILAIVVYHLVKTGTTQPGSTYSSSSTHDRSFFNER